MPPPVVLPRIAKLSPQLANRIAAGEVIERPASVIKELLENALDAGATRIKVELQAGGNELIRVIDNGHGLHPDDLELALQRHATAKLNETSDLAAISSLGFRGEALPSISSVSVLSMSSRVESMDRGAQVSVEPQSGTVSRQPAAHPVGTTVEVRQLFENTPARKKFLRSERTELLHIQEMIRRLALSRFNFSLHVEHDGRKVFNFPQTDTGSVQRVAAVIGQEFAREAINVDEQSESMRLWGWLGTGRLARSSADRQYLYLNGRMIQDRRLNHAIRVACEGLVDEGRFPAYVLHLQMDLAAADVNVHPTKHEVRFRQAGDVHDFIFAALRASLDRQPALFESGQKDIAEQRIEAAIKEGPAQVYGFSRRPAGRELSRRPEHEGNAGSGGLPGSALGELQLQLDEKLVLLRRETDLLLFDIDEARKLSAGMKLRGAGENKRPVARPLLVPVSFEITEAQVRNLECISNLLKEFSLELELSGPHSCRLRTLPQLLSNADLQSLIDDILSLEINNKSASTLKEEVIEVLLTHLSDIPTRTIKAGELYALIRQLQDLGLQLEEKQHKPVWTTLESEELQAMLKPK